MRRLVHPLLLLLTLVSACTAAPPPPKAAALRAELMKEVGDAACDSDAQCRTVAVGHKACGGPAGYMAWSSKRSSEARLKDLARRQSEAEKAENEGNGMMSNCAVVVDPGAVCKAARCELRADKPAGERAR
ncbi:hypothetical protein J7U46_16955 [Pelomonas sp. V22]|uniref:hypothetical protein n=1 Tax=Pelomonas sp. V22 TaxID=2822139 RepID=UPI0024A9958E|nr:hypothetical protein [Pelomonas sp. V22]MDI4634753.1 hypothetical protein [Pelomonas sp. V22]